MTVRSSYLIKKRILDHGNLWGVLIQKAGKLFKMDSIALFGLIAVEKRTVLVDYSGGDKPAPLSYGATWTEGGAGFYFRTVHDDTTLNNFNSVPAIKLISANKAKLLKI